MKEDRICEEEMFLLALKLVGAKLSQLYQRRNEQMKCEECDKQAVICAIGINAPLYVCPECGKAVEEALECPECEAGDLLEQRNGDLKCSACGFVEVKCVGGCSI